MNKTSRSFIFSNHWNVSGLRIYKVPNTRFGFILKLDEHQKDRLFSVVLIAFKTAFNLGIWDWNSKWLWTIKPFDKRYTIPKGN